MCHVYFEGEYVHNFGANMEVADILWSQTWAKKLVPVGTLKQFRIPWGRFFSTDTSFFAVFQTNILNETFILAIVVGILQKMCDIWSKTPFLYYCIYTSDQPISALQMHQKFIIAKTPKMMYFGGWLKCTPWHSQNWHAQCRRPSAAKVANMSRCDHKEKVMWVWVEKGKQKRTSPFPLLKVTRVQRLPPSKPGKSPRWTSGHAATWRACPRSPPRRCPPRNMVESNQC